MVGAIVGVRECVAQGGRALRLRLGGDDDALGWGPGLGLEAVCEWEESASRGRKGNEMERVRAR